MKFGNEFHEFTVIFFGAATVHHIAMDYMCCHGLYRVAMDHVAMDYM